MPSEISFVEYFADLPDPRVNRTKKHRLDDILGIALCAVVWWRYRGEDLSHVRRASAGEIGRSLVVAFPAVALPFVIRAGKRLPLDVLFTHASVARPDPAAATSEPPEKGSGLKT